MKKSPTLQKEYLQKITEAFNAFAKKMPQGRLSPDEQVEITKARELAKIDRASGTAQSASSFPATSWTVIFEDDPAFRVSPLNRVLYIKCVEKPEEVLKQMMPFKGYIQTVGIAGSLRERQRLGRLFAKAGIARVTRLGDMRYELIPADDKTRIYDAVAVAAVLGVDKAIISAAEKYMEAPDEEQIRPVPHENSRDKKTGR